MTTAYDRYEQWVLDNLDSLPSLASDDVIEGIRKDNNLSDGTRVKLISQIENDPKFAKTRKEIKAKSWISFILTLILAGMFAWYFITQYNLFGF